MDHGTVIKLIGVLAGTLGIVWAGTAIALGGRHWASWHWAASNLIFAADVFILYFRDDLPAWISYSVPNSSSLLAFVLLRRGIQYAADLPRTDREQLGLMVLALPLAITVSGPGAHFGHAVSLVSIAIAWTLFRAVMEVDRKLRGEFGSVLAAIVDTPIASFCLVYLIRAVIMLGQPESAESKLDVEGPLNEILGMALFAAILSFNISLAALAVTKLAGQLRELAQRDALTGLLNRRSIDESLEVECDRSRRGGGPFALLLLDIDYFKKVNDKYGHPTGDAALVAVASAIGRNARKSDKVGRFGGEEFCVLLLTNVTPDGVTAAAERYRIAVEDIDFAVEGERVPITVSIGAATCTNRDETASSLLSRADKALYRAKEAGRNRVVEAPSADPK